MNSGKSKTRTWTALVVVAGLVLVGWWSGIGSGFGSQPEEAIEGAEVQRGSLRISVVERGNLVAADSVDLKSEVEGQTTVLSLIEEGVFVEPGDLLCELDTSQLVERRVSQEITVQNAEAAFIKAKQSLEIQKSQNESEIARAVREKKFAEVDLEKYVEGDWPQEKRAAEEEILLRNEELTRAKQDLEWSEKLAARGFLEQTQLDADRLAKTRAEIQLNQSKRALELLEQYEFPRTRDEYKADVEEKGRELERTRLEAKAKLVDFEANERTTKAKFDLESEKFAKLDSQIEKARIVSPVAGMVVYAIEDRGRWGGGEPMQEGASVRERQKIITIPSADGYVAEASLHESVLEKVQAGLPCIVNIDALTDRTMRGEVKFKAVLPDQNSWFANPDLRVYRTEVAILDRDPRIRPGMSCSIEILVDEIPETDYVPVQAVFLDGADSICFVSDSGGVEKRVVEVGQNNGKWVEIKEGLTEGEVVLLSQPPGFTLQQAVEEPNELEGGFGDFPRDGGRPAGEHRGPIADRTGADVKGADRAGMGGKEAGWAKAAEAMKNDPEAAERMRKAIEAMKDDPEAAERFRKMREGQEKGGDGSKRDTSHTETAPSEKESAKGTQ